MTVQTTCLIKAAELLRAGRLVAFPTETVYGLGANALDEAAVRRIYAAKGRPLTSPLIVHLATIEMARSLASVWPEQAELLARKFWPGPLTIVVPKAAMVPDVVTAGLSSVALRMPDHPLALELLRECGLPLAAPSANRFTELSPTTAEHVQQGFGDGVDMILDGGACAVGIESTVVSFADSEAAILRPGMISREEIEAVIGPVRVRGGAESPGQHAKHYSPRTPVFIGVEVRKGNGYHLDFSTMPSDAFAYAALLYARLHELDALGYDWISIAPVPETPAWDGVRDRLQRAAFAGRIEG